MLLALGLNIIFVIADRYLVLGLGEVALDLVLKSKELSMFDAE